MVRPLYIVSIHRPDKDYTTIINDHYGPFETEELARAWAACNPNAREEITSVELLFNQATCGENP